MNFAKNNFGFPRFCFDENASGQGGSAGGTGGDNSGTPAASEGGGEPAAGAASAADTGGAPAGGSDTSVSDPLAAGVDPFAGMDDDFDSLDLGAETSPSPGPIPAATPPVPVPVPAPASSAAPAPTPVPVAPAAPVGNDPASARSPLESAIEGFTANEKELSVWAAQNLFKLSPEEADALTTNAEEAIPLLMGKLYTRVLAASGNLIRNFVPQMIDSRVESTSGAKARATEALNEFYTANPHLSAKDHQAVVDKYAKVFRAANPQASRQEAIQMVGRMVSAELGLMPGAPAPRGPQAQPFAPARPGGRQQVVAQGDSNSDPFWGLDQDFDVT